MGIYIGILVTEVCVEYTGVAKTIEHYSGRMG